MQPRGSDWRIVRVICCVCDAVPVMDKAAEKAGLERLLGTAGTLGLQQLDDKWTSDDSPPPDAGEDDQAEQPSGAACITTPAHVL